MFGKRGNANAVQKEPAPQPAAPVREVAAPLRTAATPAAPASSTFEPGASLSVTTFSSPPTIPEVAPPAPVITNQRTESFYEVKGQIFGALIEAIDLSQLAKLDPTSAREEIRDIVNEIISIKNVVMSIAEQEELLEDICNDVLGYGPLEPLLARDDIADIMVNGASTVYIEVQGKIQNTGIRFRDNQQLSNI